MTRLRFLTDEGLWLSGGHRVDAEGNRADFRGRCLVWHTPEEWIANVTTVGGPAHCYHLEPMLPGQFDSRWTSEHADHGPCVGMVSVVGDTLFVRGRSQDGRYHFEQTLTQISEDHLQVRGFSFVDGKRASVVIAELVWAGKP
ncbi:MAG: hypothetical protein MUC42_05900 [Bryobacter sp.]|jgi:hypothetical protein|nr:hypothetical protein [Bryobacter sp.]